MTTVTVSVDATWRMNRVEFIMPYAPTGIVTGVGEVLLQEPAQPSAGASVLRSGRIVDPTSQTYGVMPGGNVSRIIGDVAEETVEVDDIEISFSQLVMAMRTFLARWHQEDADRPIAVPQTRSAHNGNANG